MERAQDVHFLRKQVSARDKMLAVTKPVEEAVKYIREGYRTNADSARALIEYLRAVPGGGEAGSTGTVNPAEKWHMKYDDLTGTWVKVDDRETSDQQQ